MVAESAVGVDVAVTGQRWVHDLVPAVVPVHDLQAPGFVLTAWRGRDRPGRGGVTHFVAVLVLGADGQRRSIGIQQPFGPQRPAPASVRGQRLCPVKEQAGWAVGRGFPVCPGCRPIGAVAHRGGLEAVRAGHRTAPFSGVRDRLVRHGLAGLAGTAGSRGAVAAEVAESLLGEPPGQLRGDGRLIVSGALVRPAVQHRVQGGLLGGDHLPQVLIDGALGDGDIVVDRPVLADAVQPLFHLLGFAGGPGLLGLDADPGSGQCVPDSPGADRHGDDRRDGGGQLLERRLGGLLVFDGLAALQLQPAELGGVRVDLVAVVRGYHDLLPRGHLLAYPSGDVAAFGLPGQLAQRVDGHQVLGALGGRGDHRSLDRGAGRVLTEPLGGLAGLLGQVGEQVGLGLPVAGHHRLVQVRFRDGQYVFPAGRQAERRVVGAADHDAPRAEPVVQLDQVPRAVVTGAPLVRLGQAVPPQERLRAAELADPAEDGQLLAQLAGPVEDRRPGQVQHQAARGDHHRGQLLTGLGPVGSAFLGVLALIDDQRLRPGSGQPGDPAELLAAAAPGGAWRPALRTR